MAISPPTSPHGAFERSSSAARHVQRSSSRMSVGTKPGGSSRASDEDTKTAVKVAVRVRPPLRSTDAGFELIPQRFQRSMLQVISPTNLAVDSPQGRKIFVFDRVFGEDIYQEGVWDYLSESVSAFLHGYNVSILAYGQSGAGKSYTMGTSGPAEQSDRHNMGVIPRAARVLFEKLTVAPVGKNGSSNLRSPTRYSTSFTQNSHPLASSTDDQNWQMKATYVEIYNEQLRDLLAPDGLSHAERTTVAIREDVKGGILLTGLHQVEIKSLDDLLGALNFGSAIRQTDATAINAKSSRSHAVFSISLVQRKNNAQSVSVQEKRFSVPLESMNGSENWVTLDSKLHFVDLAGSERLKNTGASGDRAKEGISINAGLASLGKVISQLSSRHSGSHVSYRDSKLTRLLQDSLGGNAITYMIACVTPAEFHLSETLNTVQYAQRARAIQSKPRIQQYSDEHDKQAVIDRLRAEVSFLREQIRKSQLDDRRGTMPKERAERQNEHEIELQNHLLDLQENYTTLSQRHAKLISEITQPRDEQATDTSALRDAIGNSAVERMSRSNSFAEAVEQVVLEYEKTIQSLEASLSKTRASLSETESSLLGKETKCAYVETVNQQLQNRVQKLMDRESSTEKYLRDLESKLDGHSFGEEKNSVVIIELRKEIARIRESEASCEEYISTLEERLAEADQGVELMRREVDRLENVVERQRSLGKLDNLLYDFDHLSERDDPLGKRRSSSNFTKEFENMTANQDKDLNSTFQDAMNTPMPDSDDDDGHHLAAEIQHGPTYFQDSHQRNSISTPAASSFESLMDSGPGDPVDKFAEGSQEPFEVRVEPESSMNEYDVMSAKYEQALRTLAELQDAVGKGNHSKVVLPPSSPTSIRTTSALGCSRVEELKDSGHNPFLRSLFSEISSANSLAIQSVHRDSQVSQVTDHTRVFKADLPDEILHQEMEELKKAQAEKDVELGTLTQKYSELQDLYVETLDIVEELRAEVHKSKVKGPISPKAPFIRRKGSQAIMTIDRAHRSLASLKNIASENLADKPDTLQSFEMNLTTAMHELHQRSERVQALEAELCGLRKEMEGKMTMISGLARERSSLKSASPLDISVVSSMHDQLLEAENQMKAMCKSHALREHELLDELESLRTRLERQHEATKSPAASQSPERPDVGDGNRYNREVLEASPNVQKVVDLHGEEDSKGNQTTLKHSNETPMQKSIATIPVVITDEIYSGRGPKDNAFDLPKEQTYENKTSGTLCLDEIAELGLSYAAARQIIEEGTLDKMNLRAHLESNQRRIAFLQCQLEAQQSSAASYRSDIQSLRDSHAKTLEDLRSNTVSEANSRMESRLKSLLNDKERQRREKEAALLDSITIANQRLIRLIDSKDDVEAYANSTKVESILLSRLVSSVSENMHSLREEKTTADLRFSEFESRILEMNKSHQQNQAELQKVTEERDKACRLVDELEDQLSTTYEQHRATSSRLSMLKSNRDQALQDANAAKQKMEEEIEIHRARVTQLENQYNTGSYVDGQLPHERCNSLTSNLRTSASIASLPSPPPAIPLPPLPTSIQSMNSATATINGAAPTTNQKDELISAQFAEEQEARIRTIEKHLFAEKQLTATLEEALVDLESQGTKAKSEMEVWKKKAWEYEDELATLRNERTSTRYSVQAVEEERNARKQAEAARAHLEERMAAISRKRKKGGFNCF